MNAVVYYCTRFQFMKLYGPVLAAHFRLWPEMKAVIFIHKGKDTKKHIIATAENMACVKTMFPAVDIMEAESIDELTARYDLKALVAVGVGTFLTEEEKQSLKRRGVKFIALGHIGDEILHILMLGNKVFEEWDVITTLSQYWIDDILLAIGKGTIDESLVRAKVKPTGYVELDQVKNFDVEQIKRKYNLPLDKKIIYVSTAPVFWNLSRLDKVLLQRPFRSSQEWFVQVVNWVLQPFLANRRMEQLISYKTILQRIREHAPREKFFIVAKTRSKHNDPAFVREYVDLLVEEGGVEDFYPFRTLELLYAGDAYIGFHSASVIESVFLHKFSISLVPIPDERYDLPVEYPVQQKVFHNLLWKTPGVCVGYRIYRKKEWQDFNHALTQLAQLSCSPEKRSGVVNAMVGYDDCLSGERFILAVKELVDEKEFCPV